MDMVDRLSELHKGEKLQVSKYLGLNLILLIHEDLMQVAYLKLTHPLQNCTSASTLTYCVYRKTLKTIFQRSLNWKNV